MKKKIAIALVSGWFGSLIYAAIKMVGTTSEPSTFTHWDAFTVLVLSLIIGLMTHELIQAFKD